MKRSTFVMTSVAAAFAAMALHAVQAQADPPAPSRVATPTPSATTDALARGRYLVTVAGCNDCHTPWHMGSNGPEPDMSRMLSGHPFRN